MSPRSYTGDRENGNGLGLAAQPPCAQESYRTILCDPPWKYDVWRSPTAPAREYFGSCFSRISLDGGLFGSSRFPTGVIVLPSAVIA